MSTNGESEAIKGVFVKPVFHDGGLGGFGGAARSENQKAVLEKVNEAKFSFFHIKAILIAGVGTHEPSSVKAFYDVTCHASSFCARRMYRGHIVCTRPGLNTP